MKTQRPAAHAAEMIQGADMELLRVHNKGPSATTRRGMQRSSGVDSKARQLEYAHDGTPYTGEGWQTQQPCCPAWHYTLYTFHSWVWRSRCVGWLICCQKLLRACSMAKLRLVHITAQIYAKNRQLLADIRTKYEHPLVTNDVDNLRQKRGFS